MSEKLESTSEVKSNKHEVIVNISNQLIDMQNALIEGKEGLNYDTAGNYENRVNKMFGNIFDKFHSENGDIKPTLFGLATGGSYLNKQIFGIFENYSSAANLNDSEEKNFAGSICGAIQVAKNRLMTKQIDRNEYMTELIGVVQFYLDKTKSTDFNLQQTTKDFCDGVLLGACIDKKSRDEIIYEIEQ